MRFISGRIGMPHYRREGVCNMMTNDISIIARRRFLAGVSAAGLLVLGACESLPAFSLTEAIRRLLDRAARNAFARLMAPGGFWDNQLARLDLPEVFGRRGNVLQSILTSPLFKSRLQREFNHLAEHGARRAAPIVADAVRTIGIANARALIDGGPTAATAFLRDAMAGHLIEVMVPALDDALRVTRDPLVGEALAALTGVDVGAVARSLSAEADAAIWGEIGREESAIRADPESTNDPVLIGVFRVG
jgi:hypothetical protein